MKRTTRSVVALIAALGLTSSALPASAAAIADPAGPGATASEIVMMVRDPSGALIPIEDVIDSAQQLDMNEPKPSEPGTVTPQLINFDQWFRCFSLNQADETFVTYNHFVDGTSRQVRLKCGQHNDITNQGYGYKHIRIRHEGDWQAKLNDAVATGWVPASAGVEGWDDLMAIGAGTSITYWEYRSPIKGNNTRCTVATVAFADTSDWSIVYEFKAVAVFAEYSDRLITAYPSGSSTC